MNPKKKSKTKSSSKRKTHVKHHITRKPRATSSHQIDPTIPTTSNLTTNVNVKTCQELEVGDIGGFGSTAELEEHERRCNETASEFCSHCGKNLCHNHYDLLHRDHDTFTGRSANPALA